MDKIRKEVIILSGFKNIKELNVINIKDLINIKENMVISKNLSNNDSFNMVLLAFSKFEGVSEEEYLKDIIYYVVEGIMDIYIDKLYSLKENELILVPKNTIHKIGFNEAFKVLQISI